MAAFIFVIYSIIVNTARLEGTRSAEHPQVKAAVESEKQIRNDLHRELDAAIQGREAEHS